MILRGRSGTLRHSGEPSPRVRGEPSSSVDILVLGPVSNPESTPPGMNSRGENRSLRGDFVRTVASRDAAGSGHWVSIVPRNGARTRLGLRHLKFHIVHIAVETASG